MLVANQLHVVKFRREVAVERSNVGAGVPASAAPDQCEPAEAIARGVESIGRLCSVRISDGVLQAFACRPRPGLHRALAAPAPII